LFPISNPFPQIIKWVSFKVSIGSNDIQFWVQAATLNQANEVLIRPRVVSLFL